METLFEGLTDKDTFFRILSIYGIYAKIVTFILLFFLISYKYAYRKDKNVNIKSEYIFVFILFYIFVDILESESLYRYSSNLTKQYDKVHMTMYNDYNGKINNTNIKMDTLIAKIYDDYKINPKQNPLINIKSDTLQYDNKGRTKHNDTK